MAQITCGVCDEVIYEEPLPGMGLRLANHDFLRLPDGRNRLIARDFGVIVHECAQVPSVADMAQEIVNRESVRASRP